MSLFSFRYVARASFAGASFAGVARAVIVGLAAAFAAGLTPGVARAASPIETDAEFAVVMDYETGEVLFDKNGSTPTAPASMSKLMTVAIAFEKLKRVKSDVMVGRATAMRNDNQLEQVHIQPSDSLAWTASPRVICGEHKCPLRGDDGRPNR